MNKRVELGVHTNMSVLDGINEAGDYINEALRDWQPAIAITDRGSVQSFPRAYRIIKQSGGIKLIYGTEIYYKNDFGTFPFYILAKNKAGLKELYKIISDAYTVNFDKHPIADLSKIKSNNILLGISVMSEPIEKIIGGADDNAVLKVLSPFDYVLLNPIDYFRWYINHKEIKNKSEAVSITKRVIDICERNDIIPIASDEAKYAFSDDGEVRKMILKYKGFASYDSQPNLYFRTTGEMLAEFDFLSKTKAEEIVIKNSNMIADMVEDTFEPIDSNAEYHGDAEELKKLTYDAAYKKYGQQLPKRIENRIKSELEIICKNGKSVLQYLICKRIVNEAKNQGFETGSRGSVGASLVANLVEITNTNPLDAHYLCKKCGYIEFHPEENCGVDLPAKKCPKCNDDMERDGYSFANEFFWGYDGEKDLDIDLNLAPEFFDKAYAIVNDMFGGSIVCCGNVATISVKIAHYILDEYTKRSKLKFSNIRETDYVEKNSKIKKKTTRHPGGIFVIPQNKEIEDYTPVQIASDEIDKTVTHFDFRDLWDRLLKIDLLMIDYPSFIYKLEKSTGVKAEQIRFDDKDTYELIVSGNTEGIPEFESDLAKEILQIVKPSKFDELIKISGLTHGTGVWEDNAEELIREGKSISEIIAFRDDIMQLLIKYGEDRKEAFKTAERVRKGKGIVDTTYEHLQDVGVPDWFLDSCDSIRYAFPKAHAADYVRFAFILAYYKAHFPKEFEMIYQ